MVFICKLVYNYFTIRKIICFSYQRLIIGHPNERGNLVNLPYGGSLVGYRSLALNMPSLLNFDRLNAMGSDLARITDALTL